MTIREESGVTIEYIEIDGEPRFSGLQLSETENDRVISAISDMIEAIDVSQRPSVILSTVSSFPE